MNWIKQCTSYTIIGLLVIAAYTLCITDTSKVISVNNMNELNQYINDNDCVIIDIYASWCGPCNKFAPLYEEFAAKYPKICCIKIDGEHVPAAKKRYKVTGYPTFVIIKNGDKIGQFSGASQNIDRFEKKVFKIFESESLQ